MADAKGIHEKKEKMKPKTTLRPGSATRSAKSSLTVKSQLDSLSKENTELQSSVKKYEEENNMLKEKLRTLSHEIIDASNKADKQYELNPNMDVLEVPTNDLKSMIVNLSTSKTGAKSAVLETRIEEVETRITLLNCELGKLVILKLKVQNGLEGISSCSNLEDAKKQARLLWNESCKTNIFVDPVSEDKTASVTQHTVPVTRTFKSPSLPYAVTINLKHVDVSPVLKKLPANTHIRDMSASLTQLIVQELSLYKGSGSDWRLLAERVGIPDEMIEQWKRMKIAQPMKNLLWVWGDSPGATVRMLHRHLISPQMRKVVLAKRISDHYIVD